MPVRCQLKIAFEDMDATGGDEGIEGLDTLVVEIRGMGKKRLGCVAKLLCCAAAKLAPDAIETLRAQHGRGCHG